MAKRAAEHGFPPRAPATAMLIHLAPRAMKEMEAVCRPLHAMKSLLAGSRHGNNSARPLFNRAVKHACSKVQKVQPRAWFDDIRPRAAGGLKAVKEVIVQATKTLKQELETEGLSVASKSAIFTTDFDAATQAAKALKDAGVILKPAAEGRDLGIVRGRKTCTRRAAHAARRKKKASKGPGPRRRRRGKLECEGGRSSRGPRRPVATARRRAAPRPPS